jgi:hypothetical protein
VHAGCNRHAAWRPAHDLRRRRRLCAAGVHSSADGAEVSSPVSLVEWFLSFYEHRAAGGVEPLECILSAGEVLFVPRGWWVGTWCVCLCVCVCVCVWGGGGHGGVERGFALSAAQCC